MSTKYVAPVEDYLFLLHELYDALVAHSSGQETLMSCSSISMRLISKFDGTQSSVGTRYATNLRLLQHRERRVRDLPNWFKKLEAKNGPSVTKLDQLSRKTMDVRVTFSETESK